MRAWRCAKFELQELSAQSHGVQSKAISYMFRALRAIDNYRIKSGWH